jgi:hypothetical protein
MCVSSATPPQKLFPIFDRKPLSRPSHLEPEAEVEEISAAIPPMQPDGLHQDSSHSSDPHAIPPASESIPATQSSSSSATGGTRDDPIVLDSTPMKSNLQQEVTPAPRIIAPIFSAKARRGNSSSKPSQSRLPMGVYPLNIQYVHRQSS